MYSYQLMVEFEDVDCYGIIHHPKVLYYFERTRVHFFIDNEIDLSSLSCGLVIRNVNIQYKQQLLMLDKITVELTTKNIDKYRFDFEYKIKKNDKTYVSATMEMVVIDLATKRLSPLPDEIRALLETIHE